MRRSNPPSPTSKRAVRRIVREEREAYRLAKVDLHMGIRVTNVHLITARALRAAFAQRDSTGSPLDEAFVRERAIHEIERIIPDGMLWRHFRGIADQVCDEAATVYALQEARRLVAVVRSGRSKTSDAPRSKRHANVLRDALHECNRLFEAVGRRAPIDCRL